ncbi:TPA: 30S ribosomal protein S8 [Candidatus Nomurabacteria bacterium]|nr:MAG: 30S ribosomal protein S8 [Parcubacteria bacterium RAAC4_OD1_1]HCY26267.1 30S ribosomal protein S8 [Candidatus Nomurabacteria bacterium]
MDQIANMINMIKNGSGRGHESISVPFSKIKYSIVECLLKAGYISSVNKKIKKGFPVIEIGLAYIDGEPKVKGVSRISKNSCRVYKGVKDIKPVRNGFGMMVLTTPKGILTDKEARKEMVGGEALFKIW